MIVEVCKDSEEIKRLIEPVFDIAVADGDLYANFVPRMDGSQGWLKVTESDKIEGIVFIEKVSTVSIKFHPYLIGNKGGGRKLIKAILEWFLTTEMNKLNVAIPVIYKSTINTAKKIGFIMEGIDRESFLKSGKHVDQMLLGLTRKEIEEIL
jgi:hypothetical protein